MEKKFKLGDVVRLASGSATMTVTEVFEAKGEEKAPAYRCTLYHHADARFHDAILVEPALKLEPVTETV